MNPSSILMASGVGTFFLSFILVFSILYALFQKTKLLSERVDLNAVIAFALALIVAMFPGFSGFLIQYAPFAATVLIVIVLAFIIFGYFGIKPEEIKNYKSIIGVIIAIFVIGAIIIYSNFYYQSIGLTPNAKNVTNISKINQKQALMCSNYSKLTGAQAMGCMLGDPLFLGILITLVLMLVVVYVLVVPPKK